VGGFDNLHKAPGALPDQLPLTACPDPPPVTNVLAEYI
jgi:hypothetical protein